MEIINTSEPAPRLPLMMRVEYRRSYGRSCEKGFLVNISLTGAFLKTHTSNHNICVKDKLLFTFIVSGRERRVQAQVVWTNQDGCGIKLIPNNNRDVQIIDDLMYFVQNQKESQKDLLQNIFKRVA